jgi:hypothetical protein
LLREALSTFRRRQAGIISLTNPSVDRIFPNVLPSCSTFTSRSWNLSEAKYPLLHQPQRFLSSSPTHHTTTNHPLFLMLSTKSSSDKISRLQTLPAQLPRLEPPASETEFAFPPKLPLSCATKSGDTLRSSPRFSSCSKINTGGTHVESMASHDFHRCFTRQRRRGERA